MSMASNLIFFEKNSKKVIRSRFYFVSLAQAQAQTQTQTRLGALKKNYFVNTVHGIKVLL